MRGSSSAGSRLPRVTSWLLAFALVSACGSSLEIAVAAFENCMTVAGFPVTSVSVSERPTDGALSFGWSLERGDNGAIPASADCTEQAAALIGRKGDP
ncbi:MAG: hypothetical protein ACRDVD_04870 [Acidimicrobiia bacterium]